MRLKDFSLRLFNSTIKENYLIPFSQQDITLKWKLLQDITNPIRCNLCHSQYSMIDDYYQKLIQINRTVPNHTFPPGEYTYRHCDCEYVKN